MATDTTVETGTWQLKTGLAKMLKAASSWTS